MSLINVINTTSTDIYIGWPYDEHVSFLRTQ